jgi:ATP synthase protein I
VGLVAGEPAGAQLDSATLAVLDAHAARGIIRALAAQAAMGLVAVLISWLFAGLPAGASALIGAATYLVPNALFALRLLAGLAGGQRANPFTFFLGEMVKLGSVMLLLGAAAYYGRGWVVWPALLFGLLCVLKGYVLLLVLHKLP